MAKITWDELVQLEPALDQLLQQVRQVQAGPGFCANRVWYGPNGFKAKLLKLVGWERQDNHPVLSTDEAYDVAYDVLYEALPACQHESEICPPY